MKSKFFLEAFQTLKLLTSDFSAILYARISPPPPFSNVSRDNLNLRQQPRRRDASCARIKVKKGLKGSIEALKCATEKIVKMDKLRKNKMTEASYPAKRIVVSRSGGSWRCSVLKITKRVLRGTKLDNRRRCRGRVVFAGSVSSSAIGATGGSVWPLFHPFSILFLFLSLSLPSFRPLCRFSIRHPLPISLPGSLAPLALARGCDLKCKLKYPSWVPLCK